MSETDINMGNVFMAAGIVKKIPGTAAQRAETAQAAAEEAAAVAATHNYGISVSGSTLVITPPEEQEG